MGLYFDFERLIRLKRLQTGVEVTFWGKVKVQTDQGSNCLFKNELSYRLKV
jgi:hypothetical protein